MRGGTGENDGFGRGIEKAARADRGVAGGTAIRGAAAHSGLFEEPGRPARLRGDKADAARGRNPQGRKAQQRRYDPDRATDEQEATRDRLRTPARAGRGRQGRAVGGAASKASAHPYNIKYAVHN